MITERRDSHPLTTKQLSDASEILYEGNSRAFRSVPYYSLPNKQPAHKKYKKPTCVRSTGPISQDQYKIPLRMGQMDASVCAR